MSSSVKVASHFHVVSLLFLLILLLKPTAAAAAAATSTMPSSSSSSTTRASIRKPLLKAKVLVDCSQIKSRSECILNSRCKWCRSESINDMCFSKSEAWRLPSQVFNCD